MNVAAPLAIGAVAAGAVAIHAPLLRHFEAEKRDKAVNLVVRGLSMAGASVAALGALIGGGKHGPAAAVAGAALIAGAQAGGAIERKIDSDTVQPPLLPGIAKGADHVPFIPTRAFELGVAGAAFGAAALHGSLGSGKGALLGALVGAAVSPILFHKFSGNAANNVTPRS